MAQTAHQILFETDLSRGRSRPASAELKRTRLPSRRSPCLRPEVDLRLEKWLLLALAVAAVIGIDYGFSCLLDLVQNWASMERGISTLI